MFREMFGRQHRVSAEVLMWLAGLSGAQCLGEGTIDLLFRRISPRQRQVCADLLRHRRLILNQGELREVRELQMQHQQPE
jgi:hypothetical protein